MPKARGKKSTANNENVQPYSYAVDISPEVGLGLGGRKVLASYQGTEINEMMESFFQEISNSIQAKKGRMEQLVNNALKSSNDKLARCSIPVNKGQNGPMEFLPIRSEETRRNNLLSKIKSDDEKSVKTIQRLMKHNAGTGFRNALLDDMAEFRKRAESFVKAIDEQEIKQQEQIGKMQQELKNEMVIMQKNMVKNEMKTMKNVLGLNN